MKTATPSDKEKVNTAFTNGCGRLRQNLVGVNDNLLTEWQENGWIELREDQPLPYYERKLF